MITCSSCGKPIENFPDFLDASVEVKCRDCFGTAPKPGDAVSLPKVGQARYDDEEEEA